MSVRNDHLSMRQMLDHAHQACEMVHGRKRSDLDSDYMLQLALTRLVEIMGEAASRVSLPMRENHGEIPWQDMVSMRNRLIHGYDTVDLDLLWDTIEIDLPTLIASLEDIIEKE